MTRRVGLLVLVAVTLLAALPMAQASVTVIGDPQPGGSVKIVVVVSPEDGFDTIELLSGLDHGTPAAPFELPRAFRNCPGWTDWGRDTTNYVVASGTRVTPTHLLVFDLYMTGSDLTQPFAFDLYGFDSQRGNALDLSANVAWSGTGWSYAEPAFGPYVALSGGPVPEPGALIIWSLLGGLAVAVGRRGRRRA